MRLTRALRLVPAAAVALAAACGPRSASPGATPTPSAAAAPSGALAAYAGHPLAFFPLQRVTGDSTGVAADSLRQRFDDAVASAARGAGVATGWAMAAELERSARRNPGFVTDPRTLSIGGLASRRPDDEISGALGGELRSAVALHDARFAVVPFLLRVAADGGARRATVSLVVVDARTARVVWRSEAAGVGASDVLATAVAAEHVAALFVAP
jgi:hypothetical protein